MRIAAWVGARRRATVGFVANTVVLVGVVVAATAAVATPNHHASLNDGGIWVTDQQTGYWGRFNKPALQLDGELYSPVATAPTPSSDLDVVQDGGAVLARDGALVFPIVPSTVRGLKQQALRLPSASSPLELAGGTVATVDVGTGTPRVWRYSNPEGSDQATFSSPSAFKKYAVGATAVLAVSPDGTVHVFSGDTGRTLTLQPTPTGGFSAPVVGRVGAAKKPQVTAVGSGAVEYDSVSGTLYLPDGRTVAGPKSGVLQQPGAQADDVVLAAPDALWRVPLRAGGPQRITTVSADGTAAAPVRLGSDIYAAWGGSAHGTYVHVSGTGRAVTREVPGRNGAPVAVQTPVFRVNRGQVLLQDAATGAIWVFDADQVREVDNWPTPQQNHSQNDQPPNSAQEQLSQDAPKAVDQTVKARAGRTSVLHLLDKVEDPSGATLALTEVSQPADKQVQVALSQDLQTASVSLPATFASATTFDYSISDGAHPASTATVTVVPATGNTPPHRVNGAQSTVSVPVGGSVSIGVLGDWRDDENDALSFAQVTASGGTVVAGSDGQLRYTAPATPGSTTITYLVSDGFLTTTGTVPIDVVGGNSPAVAPTARDDVVSAVAGVPVTFSPLANDQAGADPAHPDATLSLAGPVTSVPSGLTANTDLAHGLVTVAAASPGSYTFSYQAAFGSAPVSQTAAVRVVVSPGSNNLGPVAVPDTATVHGLHPTLVDVLANDFSPTGGLLATVSVSVPTEAASHVSASVVGQHWVRVQSLGTQSGPISLGYTITDGQHAASGQINVVQVPDAPDPTPLAVDDTATVRAGQVVDIPVTVNDIDPNGETLTLAAATLQPPAHGSVVGTVTAVGNVVRYVPPSSVTASTPVVARYTVRNQDGVQGSGFAYITVTPAITDPAKDQPPTPLNVTATVTSGSVVDVSIPTYGVDPDGDTIAVVGLASAPHLGRVVSQTPTSIRYEAFPSATLGTDQFSYIAEDPYGRTAQATVQVLVLPPAPTPAPVAVDDDVTVPATGQPVTIDVLANDLYEKTDTVTVQPLATTESDAAVRAAAKLDGTLLTVQLPSGRKQMTVTYGITDLLHPASLGHVNLTLNPSMSLAPVAHDDAAGATDLVNGTSAVVVDVLANDRDWDGTTANLRLATSQPDGASAVPCPTGGQTCLSVPTKRWAFDVPYEITNGTKTAVGVLHVPGLDDLRSPHLRTDAVLKVASGSRTTVNLADFVQSAPGTTPKLLHVDSVAAAPTGVLTVTAGSFTSFTAVAAGGYRGPAAITMTVTDGLSAADPKGLVRVLMLPVQVGADVPVLRCPTDPLAVVVDDSISLDLDSYCALWVADGDSQTAVNFSVAPTSLPSVSASVNGHVMKVSASPNATAGTTGTIRVTPSGSGGDGDAVTIPVTVVTAPPDVLHPVQVRVNAGASTTVDVTPYLTQTLPDAHVVALATKAGQNGVSVSADGNSPLISVSANSDAKGTVTVPISATDAKGNPARSVTSALTVTVIGHPDAPTGLTVVGRPTSQTVTLDWASPPSNGADIQYYTVTGGNGTTKCAAAPCPITGLTNGTSYTFSVTATNAIGTSPSSGSVSGVPQAVPGDVTSTVVPGFRSISVSWSNQRRPQDGSVDYYSVETSPAIPGAPTQLPNSATSVTLSSGIDFDQPYTINVIAHNSYGASQDSNHGQVQAWATPVWQGQPHVDSQSQSSAAADQETVNLSWPAVDWQGPAGHYTVAAHEQGSGASQDCPVGAGATSATCSVQQTGKTYYFVVTATNAGTSGATSATAQSGTFVAADTPAAPSSVAVKATGNDNELQVTYTMGDAHDASGYTAIQYSLDGTSWSTLGASPALVHTPSEGAPVTVYVRGCNHASANPCGPSGSGTDTPYGQPDAPQPTGGTSGQSDTKVYWTWAANPGGGHGQGTGYYTVAVQGGATTNVGSATSWSMDTGAYSSTRCVVVTFHGSYPAGSPDTASSGNVCSTSGSAPPPPPPTQSVTVHWGGAAPSSRCNGDPTCTYITVDWSGFSGGSHTVCMRDDFESGCWFTVNVSGSSGSHAGQLWFGYGGQHHQVWAVVDSTSSNQIDSYGNPKTT